MLWHFPSPTITCQIGIKSRHQTSLRIDVLTLVINWSKWISLSINSNKHICSLLKKNLFNLLFLTVPWDLKNVHSLFKNHDDYCVCSTLLLICWQSEIWNTVFTYFMFASQWIELHKAGHGQITRTRTNTVPNSLI